MKRQSVPRAEDRKGRSRAEIAGLYGELVGGGGSLGWGEVRRAEKSQDTSMDPEVGNQCLGQ